MGQQEEKNICQLIIYPYWILNVKKMLSDFTEQNAYNLSILDFKLNSRVANCLYGKSYNLSILDFKSHFASPCIA